MLNTSSTWYENLTSLTLNLGRALALFIHCIKCKDKCYALEWLLHGHVRVVVHHLLVRFVHPRCQALQRANLMSALFGRATRCDSREQSTYPVSLVQRPGHHALVVNDEAIER